MLWYSPVALELVLWLGGMLYVFTGDKFMVLAGSGFLVYVVRRLRRRIWNEASQDGR